MKINPIRVKEVFPWVLGGVMLIGSFLLGLKKGKDGVGKKKIEVANGRGKEVGNGAQI